MSEPLTALITSTEAALERHKQGRLGPTGVSVLLMDTLHQLRGLAAARARGLDVADERLAILLHEANVASVDQYSSWVAYARAILSAAGEGR